jgi:murein tripeptide amidase MpaA
MTRFFFARNSRKLHYLKYRFHVIPVVNIDGYLYTRIDRLWRKNRQLNDKTKCKGNHNPNCIGTDIDRNFPYSWGKYGASQNPCENTYQGSSPLSAPCASSLYLYIRNLSNGSLTLTISGCIF